MDQRDFTQKTIELPELKTLELDIINSDLLIWISTVETFIFNPLSLDIICPSTYNKDKFDYKYRNETISIELIPN